MSDKAALQDKMDLRDKISPSPEQRAAFLYEAVNAKKPTLWDLVCFCTEVLGVVAVEYTWLKPFAARLVSIVYTAHYNTPDPFPSVLDAKREPEGAIVEPSIATVLGSNRN